MKFYWQNNSFQENIVKGQVFNKDVCDVFYFFIFDDDENNNKIIDYCKYQNKYYIDEKNVCV